MISQRQIHFFMASLSGFACFLAIIGLFFAGESTGKELRPSEHGLEFQNSPSSAWFNYSSGMRSFFNSSQVSNSSDIMTIRKPSNSSDSSPAAWWRTDDDDGGRSHVRKALVIASLVCGVTGVILLVATGLLFLSKHRKHNNNKESGEKDNDKLQLAVRSENL